MGRRRHKKKKNTHAHTGHLHWKVNLSMHVLLPYLIKMQDKLFSMDFFGPNGNRKKHPTLVLFKTLLSETKFPTLQ